MSFRLRGLDEKLFAGLFELPDAELRAHGAVRLTAPASSALPCRICLDEVAPGTELLLLPFMHQTAESPYRASGPIYVARGAKRRSLDPGVLPPSVTNRQISVRAYDAAHWIVDACVCPGAEAAAPITRYFDNPAVSYIHLHNARRGCFACLVERAEVSRQPSGAR